MEGENGRILEVAEKAAGMAAAIIARHFREGVERLRSKGAGNLVTVTDVEAERAIVAAIRASFPDHAILAEEEHAATAIAAENLWVIDPLDGTNNFAHGIDQVAVSIAFFHRGMPQVGVVVNPLREQWHMAVRGQGAYLNGARVHVSEHQRLDEILFGVGFYYDRGIVMEATLQAVAELIRAGTHGIRRFGAAALDLCLVGTGQLGTFFEFDLSAWDYAGGWLFVEEAGGRVSDAHGRPLSLRRSSIVASNPHVHEAVLAITRDHCPATA
jgi:myo-inositol-1(or 4)-monophosphatase